MRFLLRTALSKLCVHVHMHNARTRAHIFLLSFQGVKNSWYFASWHDGICDYMWHTFFEIMSARVFVRVLLYSFSFTLVYGFITRNLVSLLRFRTNYCCDIATRSFSNHWWCLYFKIVLIVGFLIYNNWCL